MKKINVRSASEIEELKKACRVVAKVLAKVDKEIKPGVTTEYLDSFCEKIILAEGAEPLFKGYHGYAHATCVSVNEEIVHGIPGKKVLNDGDIVTVDVGARINGYCGDSAKTFTVGKTSPETAKLIKTCRESLAAGIEKARAGNHLGDISSAIDEIAKKNGYSVVRDLYGHGIGTELHEDPLIPNFGEPGSGPLLKPGMVFCIEPMLNIGGWKIKTLSDGWTVVTLDKSLSCHFEHQIVITSGDPEILTLRNNG